MHDTSERVASASLAALIQAFRCHPRYDRLVKRTAGLGTELPWTEVECSGDMLVASGLVVGGSHDAGEWDLDGTFLLFSTDDLIEGEILVINGWIGEVRLVAEEHRQGPLVSKMAQGA